MRTISSAKTSDLSINVLINSKVHPERALGHRFFRYVMCSDLVIRTVRWSASGRGRLSKLGLCLDGAASVLP
jgi:hypothetical protein